MIQQNRNVGALPDNPILRNHLSAAYSRAGQYKKAELVAIENYEKYPDYIFAKTNYAQFCLWHGKINKITAIFNHNFNLNSLYPKRKTFHISEFLSFMEIMSIYFFKIGEKKKRYGMFNLETFELESHNPALGSRCQVQAYYYPEAECPKFEKFLNQVTEWDTAETKEERDEALGKRILLQEYAGYILQRSCKYEKALVLKGDGSNGKGVFIKVMQAMVGDENVSALSLPDLGDKYKIPFLKDRMLNVCGESSEKDNIDYASVRVTFCCLLFWYDVTIHRQRGTPLWGEIDVTKVGIDHISRVPGSTSKTLLSSSKKDPRLDALELKENSPRVQRLIAA